MALHKRMEVVLLRALGPSLLIGLVIENARIDDRLLYCCGAEGVEEDR